MDIERLKALLRLASCRSKVLRERLEAQAKVLRATIISLCKQHNQVQAGGNQVQGECLVRVQTLIRDDYLQEVYVQVDSFCQVKQIDQYFVVVDT